MSESNPVAIVTGASRGIGKAAALYFASQGYDVALVARNETLLNEVKTEVEKNNVKAGVFALDVTDSKAVHHAVEKIITAHGRIDVLFNNAGIVHPGTDDIEQEKMQQLIDVNLMGVYHFVHAVTPHMKKQQSGYIFNVASRAGKIASVFGAYGLTKFGVVGYSLCLSKELIQHNIKVTALCPSVIETDMTASFTMPNEEKIRVDDIVKTIDYCLALSPTAIITDIDVKCRAMECGSSIITAAK